MWLIISSQIMVAHAHIHTRRHAHTHTRTHTYTQIHIHTRAHTHTHTETHTQTQTHAHNPGAGSWESQKNLQTPDGLGGTYHVPLGTLGTTWVGPRGHRPSSSNLCFTRARPNDVCAEDAATGEPETYGTVRLAEPRNHHLLYPHWTFLPSRPHSTRLRLRSSVLWVQGNFKVPSFGSS
jgi:hypothetical protein